MSYLDDSLKRRTIFFTGKGGVGKSSLAWATALACKRRGARVAVAGWQPLGKQTSAPLFESLDIKWIGLETLSAFREYALQIIRFQKLYDSVLDNHVLRTFVSAAPGLADAVMAGKIWDLYQRKEQDILLIDMPSSGHAKSFFKSPLGIQKLFKVGFIARDAERVCELFRSPETRLDLVSLPEELPLVECRELKESLAPLHAFSFGFLHLNQCLPLWLRSEDSTLQSVSDEVRTSLQIWNSRLADQEQTLSLAQTVGLAELRHPRQCSNSWKENVENLASHLETL